MYHNANILNIIALLSSLAITPALADGWPKRGLAANEDVPIWQVCTDPISILPLSLAKEKLLLGQDCLQKLGTGFFSGAPPPLKFLTSSCNLFPRTPLKCKAMTD